MAVAMAAPRPSVAADTLLVGAKLKVADATQPGGARRKLVFATRDPAVIISADSGAGDPTLNGGQLTLVNTAGSGESQTFALAAANWRRIPGDLDDPVTGWKYKEVVFDPPADDYKMKVALKRSSTTGIVRVVIKDDRGSFIAFTLDEPTQGSLGLEVSTGADRQCTDFGGTIVEDLSESASSGTYRGRFVAKAAPAPGSCSSPSGAFVD
jgi:hypothetical protein